MVSDTGEQLRTRCRRILAVPRLVSEERGRLEGKVELKDVPRFAVNSAQSDKPEYAECTSRLCLVEFPSSIPEDLRLRALSEGIYCSMCGAEMGDEDPYAADNLLRFSVSYVLEIQGNDACPLSNLRALCSVCNEGAQNMSPKRPDWVDLLVQIRRAPALAQVEALKWLIKKFPSQASEMVENQHK